MGCISVMKYVLFFFNMLYFLLGIAIFSIGVILQGKWSVFSDEIKSMLTMPAWMFITTGAIIFVIAFFGCCGPINESLCMVVMYAILLLIVITAQVAFAVLLYTSGDTIEEGFINTLGDMFQASRDSKAIKSITDSIQRQFHCCDWSGIKTPGSCCSENENYSDFLGLECIRLSSVPTCDIAIKQFYEHYETYIVGSAIGVVSVEVISTVLALCQACYIKKMDREYDYIDYSY